MILLVYDNKNYISNNGKKIYMYTYTVIAVP